MKRKEGSLKYGAENDPDDMRRRRKNARASREMIGNVPKPRGDKHSRYEMVRYFARMRKFL